MHILNRCVVLAIIFIIAGGLSGCGKDDGNVHPLLQNIDSGVDTDRDGTEDNADNCPDTANPEQTDTDADGRGDRCDDDDDNDGLEDLLDPATLDPAICGDADGDTCDDCSVGNDGFGPLADNDAGNDGPDLDGDGTCDAGDDDPTNGRPLVHYKFNAQDGATIADHGLAQAPATLTGGLNANSDEEGHPEEAYTLSGSDNYVEIDAAGLEKINAVLTDEITVVMTCRHGGNASSALIPMLQVEGHGGEHISLNRLMTLINLHMDLDHNGESAAVNSLRLTDFGGWHHIALTYSEHTAKLYINGNAVGLGYAEDAGIFDIAALKIPGDVRDLTVSDFRIYDRSLKHEKIKALWNKMHAHFTLDAGHTTEETTVVTDLARDVAGQYSGIFRGSNPTSFRPARFIMTPYREYEGAVEFNGGNCIELDSQLTAGLSGDTFTIAAWIKPLDAQGGGVIASKAGWRLWQEGSAIKFGVYSDEGAAECEYSNFDTSGWHTTHNGWMHVVATWDRFSGRAVLFVNGERINSANNNHPIATGNDPILIGARYGEDNQPGDYWRGVMDDLRFFNKALQMETLHQTPNQAEVPGIRQLFEEGYLVRGYTDCAFPYEDCNPAADQVLMQYLSFYDADTDGNPVISPPTERGEFTTFDIDGVYDYVLDADSSHIQGSQWFLPPRDRWFVYSRSTHNDYFHVYSSYGPEDRIFGVVDWLNKRVDQFEYVFSTINHWPHPWPYPMPSGELDHGGGIQAIGKYFIVPVDSNGGSASADTVYTVMYNLDDLLIALNGEISRDRDKCPGAPMHYVIGSVQKDGSHTADVFGAIVKESTGKYLWLDGHYGADWGVTNMLRLAISGDGGLASRPPFSFIDEVDITNEQECRQLAAADQSCLAGNWNAGTLIAQTDGRIYLLLTAPESFLTQFSRGTLNLLEVRIDKIASTSNVLMNQPKEDVTLDMDNPILFSGLNLKAGAGGHITRNGKLTVFTTSLSDGYTNDYVDWGQWESFWNY